MHRQFLFSLTVFGPPTGNGSEGLGDAAFAAWYASLRVDGGP
jgi:hypothetical protein